MNKSLLKTISFGAMHISIAFTIVYLMTGDFMVGGAVALVEPLCNSVAYFFHERLWDRRRPHAVTEAVAAT